MTALLYKPKAKNKDQNLYPYLPPPTYQEAKDMPTGEHQPKATIRLDSATDNEHAMENLYFKHIYPYYGKEEAS